MRIDGYYRLDYGSGQEARTRISFFFENGILCRANTVFQSEIAEFEQSVVSGALHNDIKDSKTRWGIFQVDGDVIRYEKWYPSNGGFPAFVRERTILNDTTFHITHSYRLCDGEKTEEKSEDQLYYFVPFSPKIDSTNQFVP